MQFSNWKNNHLIAVYWIVIITVNWAFIIVKWLLGDKRSCIFNCIHSGLKKTFIKNLSISNEEWNYFRLQMMTLLISDVGNWISETFWAKKMGLKAKTANFIFDSKVFLFDYRAKKMSFCCFKTFLCRTVFEQQLVKVRDFERSTNVQLVIKLFFFRFFKNLPWSF